MTAPRLSAADLSGVLYEHYRDILLEDTSIFSQFHGVCSQLARGQLPPQARAALSSCRLLAMVKPVVDGPDGVRPIAVAEVFQRLISRAIALQMRDTFQEHFSPLQYAVATSAGCETIVAGVQALLEADPELLVLQVNMANAFNEVDAWLSSRSSGLTSVLCFLLLNSLTLTPALCSTEDRMAAGRLSSLALVHARVILWRCSFLALRF
jgi:hypothetical protein